MKKLIPISSMLLLILCLFSNTGFAQFKEASITDYAVGLSPIQALNTGNYIYEHNNVNYIVNVWDDNGGPNAALSWEVGSASGFDYIDQTTIVVDPDVCIVKNAAGVFFAIVAYYDQINSQFMMRVFNWNTGSQSFVGTPPVLLEPGQYYTSINIDANDYGDFAIVWDQPGNIIQMAFGSAGAGLPPILSFPGSVFTLDPGKMPDVSVNRNAANNNRQVDVAYISDVEKVTVDFYKINQLQAGNLITIPAFRSDNADLEYKYPRIDTPPAIVNVSTEFTVVVEDSDNNSTWYIKGFNSHSCCPGFTSVIYNNGSANSPYDISGVANTRPVVSYQDNASGINIGWNLDNGFGLLAAPGASIAQFPVVLSCDKTSEIHPAAKYLTVPVGVTFGTSASNLSISSRFSSKSVYTFLNNIDGEIYYKPIWSFIDQNHLRESTPTSNFFEWLNETSESENGLASDQIHITIYDIVGREVLNFNGEKKSFLSVWQSFRNKATSGVFSVQAQKEKDNSVFTGKLFIGN